MGDHVILDTVVVPGTAFVELALTAGAEVGCETVAELTSPGAARAGGPGRLELQLLVGGGPTSRGGGRSRSTPVHRRRARSRTTRCRPSGPATPAACWPRICRRLERASSGWAAESWPPRAPSRWTSRASTTAWRRRVRLRAGFHGDPGGVATRRGALRRGRARAPARRGGRALRRPPRAARRGAAGRCGDPAGDEEEGAEGRGAILFSLSGVRRYASGSSALRVRVTSAGGSALSVAALDETGAPVVSRRFAGRTAGGGGAACRRGPAGARQLVQPGVGGAARSHRRAGAPPNRTARRCARRPRRATPRRPGRAGRGDRRAGSRARGGGRGHRERRVERAADRRRGGRAGREGRRPRAGRAGRSRRAAGCAGRSERARECRPRTVPAGAGAAPTLALRRASDPRAARAA